MPASSRDLKHLCQAFKGKKGYQVELPRRHRQPARRRWVFGTCAAVAVLAAVRMGLDDAHTGLNAFDITPATAASNVAIVTPSVEPANHQAEIVERSILTGTTSTTIDADAMTGAANVMGSNVSDAPSDTDDLQDAVRIAPPSHFPQSESVVTPSNPEDSAWLEVSVERGDSLSEIFTRNGVNLGDALALAKMDEAGALSRLVPGRSLQVLAGDQGRVKALRYELDYASELHAEKSDTGFTVAIVARELETRQHEAHVTIDSSLFVSGMKAGIPNAVLLQLTEIFGWAIDFALDVRRGDEFKVIYEEPHFNGERVATGEIVAADFVNNGRVYRAIRLMQDGEPHYYTPEGESLRRAFLRTPVQYTRITSKFTNRRFHPVLKRWRAHRGVDYGAPRGTPVRATADGKVELRGKQRGYGNVIILRHGRKYSTVYAHLSKFAKKVKRGSTVKQGDTIGYVGSTGYATGPHLHYEFRVNNKHQNPLTVELPASLPVPEEYRQAFEGEAAIWSAKLDSLQPQSVIAAGDDNQS